MILFALALHIIFLIIMYVFLPIFLHINVKQFLCNTALEIWILQARPKFETEDEILQNFNDLFEIVDDHGKARSKEASFDDVEELMDEFQKVTESKWYRPSTWYRPKLHARLRNMYPNSVYYLNLYLFMAILIPIQIYLILPLQDDNHLFRIIFHLGRGLINFEDYLKETYTRVTLFWYAIPIGAAALISSTITFFCSLTMLTLVKLRS